MTNAGEQPYQAHDQPLRPTATTVLVRGAREAFLQLPGMRQMGLHPVDAFEAMALPPILVLVEICKSSDDPEEDFPKEIHRELLPGRAEGLFADRLHRNRGEQCPHRAPEPDYGTSHRSVSESGCDHEPEHDLRYEHRRRTPLPRPQRPEDLGREECLQGGDSGVAQHCDRRMGTLGAPSPPDRFDDRSQDVASRRIARHPTVASVIPDCGLRVRRNRTLGFQGAHRKRRSGPGLASSHGGHLVPLGAAPGPGRSSDSEP